MVGHVGVGSVQAGASRGQLEALDGEGEVLVIGIVDEESVVDGLLQTLGLVAFGHERARRSGAGALLDAGGLAEGFVVGLDAIDDDPPLAVDVDGSQGLDVFGFGGAQVSLLDDVLKTVDGVLGVGQDILVELLHGIVVILDGLLDLVGGVFGVLETISVGLVVDQLGALGRAVIVGGVMRGSIRVGVVRGAVMRGGVMRSGVAVGGGVGRVGGHRSVSRGGVAVSGGRSVGGGVGMIRSGCVMGRRMHRVMRSVGMGSTMMRNIGFGFGLGLGVRVAKGDGQHGGENLEIRHDYE